MTDLLAFMFMPPDLSTHGGGIDNLMLWLHVLMGILFVGWGAFFVYTLIRFRRKRSPRADYEGVKSHTSSYVEISVVIAECVLLFGLAIPLWGNWVDLGRPDPEEAKLQVRVIAQQFAWNVQYPGPDGQFGRLDPGLINEQLNPVGLDREDPAAQDDVVLVNQLLVPVDTPVVVNVTSMDVIHSFFLPVMRVKQDAIPGISIPIGFRAQMTSMDFKEEQVQANEEEYEDKKARAFLEASSDDYENLDAARKALEDGDGFGDLKKLVPDFEIACAQLCGRQHYRMRGQFHILSQEEFAGLRTQQDFTAWITDHMTWQFSD